VDLKKKGREREDFKGKAFWLVGLFLLPQVLITH
jgi:hypothetical protein